MQCLELKVHQDHLVFLGLSDHLEIEELWDLKVNMVTLEKLVKRDLLANLVFQVLVDPKVHAEKRDLLANLVLLELVDTLVTKENLVTRVLLVLKVSMKKVVVKVLLVHLVTKVCLETMVCTYYRDCYDTQ